MHAPNLTLECTIDQETKGVVEARPNLNLVHSSKVFRNHKSPQKCIGASHQIEVTIKR